MAAGAYVVTSNISFINRSLVNNKSKLMNKLKLPG